MLCRRNSLSKLNHRLALQLGADQIHCQHPSGVIESVELDAVLMLPRVITLTAIPLDQVCEINCGLCWHVERCYRPRGQVVQLESSQNSIRKALPPFFSAEIGLPERNERGKLLAVATTVLFSLG